MKNKKWYEWLLLAVYIAMVLLCIILNVSGGQKEGLANLIVNIGMFIIIAVIFLCCEFNSFRPMGDITADLDRVTDKIRTDALNTHDYLWKPYSAVNSELFHNDKLKALYQDFLFVLNHKKDGENAYYKPRIDEYINEDLVDTVMHRNMLNQVAGALTGLGILGTFIGLSLGLQHFNTGTTAEITSSIEPLMEGIKVAFHTSIYGMIFSLVFNFVYKRKLYDSEESIKAFLSAWKKFVMPDTEDDVINRLIALEEEQLNALNTFGQNMRDEVAAQMQPNFERLGKLISDFQAVATADQREAIGKVAEEFTKEMNKSLDGTFTKIGLEVDEQYKLLRQNAEQMREFYRTVIDSEDEIKTGIAILKQQSALNEKMREDMEHNMQEVTEACNDAAGVLGQLHDDLERIAKSRRKPV